MFEGKIFLPLTGIPILNRARRRQLLAVWLPDPLTVAATMVKLLTPAGLSSISVGRTPCCTVVILIGELDLSARFVFSPSSARQDRCLRRKTAMVAHETSTGRCRKNKYSRVTSSICHYSAL